MLRFSAICVVVGVAAVSSLAAAAVPTVSTATTAMAIITQDQAYLRAAPRDSAQQQAVLSHGEVVEVRGERMDYVQVYDHRRERGGYVRATQLKRIRFAPEEAAELLGVVRFLRDTIGAEALGIGYVAAYLKAASGAEINSEAGAEAFDALGLFAERLARRASFGNALSRPAVAIVTAHLDVAARYGVTFNSYEQEGLGGQGGQGVRMQICYNGEAFARVLAISAQAERRANAALTLTRYECINPALRPIERAKLDEWRADVLSRVETTTLPTYLKNRVQMRRAAVWSSIAYQQVRQGGAAQAAAQRAISEFAGVNKRELTDDDIRVFNDTAMRVNASRWAAEPELVAANTKKPLAVVTEAGQPGETCVLLITNAARSKQALARRCTYGIVWTGSATINREGTALALAVQPMEGWRELWVFHKGADGWSVGVLPPAATSPDIGYAEFAGWVPGGKQMLVAREARGEGKYKRSFELVRLNGFATERQASDPTILGVFRRWQDPAWVKHTLSMR